MARLPTPGADSGTWGSVLNDYLSQSLKNDGTIKDNVVTSSAIAPNAVTATEIANDAITATQIQDGTITEAQLASTVQTKLNAAADSGSIDWSAITNKPAVIAAGADQAAARTAIGAGTSNLVIGTSSATAKAGDYTPTKSDVGLANVDNTSDLTKNSATATLTNKTISGASNTLTNIAQNSVTNLASDLSTKVDKATLTNKGDIYVASAASTPARVGIGIDGQVLTADSAQTTGVKWTTITNPNQGYATYVGDGTSGPFTITHNLGSRDVLVNVYKTGGTYEQIMVRTDRVTPNTVVLGPDGIWTTNQYRVLVGFIAQSDSIAPTTPVLAVTAYTTTSLTVSATNSTDAVGVVAYNWYLNNSFVATTTGSSYIYAGLDTATSYNLSVSASDFAGNESSRSSVVSQSTDIPASVVYDATGVGAYSVSAAGNTQTVSWTHAVGSGGSRYLIVGVVVSHASWNDPATYTSMTLTSSLGGTFTRIGYRGMSTAGQYQGSVNFFALQSPTVGTHTLTASVTASQFVDRIMGNSVSYQNVGSLGTPVTATSTASNAAMNLSVPSATNNYTVALGAFNASPSGFNRTSRYAYGSAVNGNGDYMILGDAAGAASVSYTTSSTGHSYTAIGVNLIKAGS